MEKVKNKLLIFAVLVLLLFSFLVLTSSDALAVGAAYFNADTTVPLTVGGVTVNFTIAAESHVNSVVFNTSSIDINISDF